jgi:hypothetical protein
MRDDVTATLNFLAFQRQHMAAPDFRLNPVH